jgi:hypothetical protein
MQTVNTICLIVNKFKICEVVFASYLISGEASIGAEELKTNNYDKFFKN